jgi:hypothetical protein
MLLHVCPFFKKSRAALTAHIFIYGAGHQKEMLAQAKVGGSAALLLLYCCFTAALHIRCGAPERNAGASEGGGWLSANRLLLYCCFTAALLRRTAALLLLYCCFRTRKKCWHKRRKARSPQRLRSSKAAVQQQ